MWANTRDSDIKAPLFLARGEWLLSLSFSFGTSSLDALASGVLSVLLSPRSNSDGISICCLLMLGWEARILNLTVGASSSGKSTFEERLEEIEALNQRF